VQLVDLSPERDPRMTGIDSPEFWFMRRFREHTMRCRGWNGEKPDLLRVAEFIGGPLDGEWRSVHRDEWRVPMPAPPPFLAEPLPAPDSPTIMGTYSPDDGCLTARVVHTVPTDHTHVAIQLRWQPYDPPSTKEP
jgi:hypothetical protein